MQRRSEQVCPGPGDSAGARPSLLPPFCMMFTAGQSTQHLVRASHRFCSFFLICSVRGFENFSPWASPFYLLRTDATYLERMPSSLLTCALFFFFFTFSALIVLLLRYSRIAGTWGTISLPPTVTGSATVIVSINSPSSLYIILLMTDKESIQLLMSI